MVSEFEDAIRAVPAVAIVRAPRRDRIGRIIDVLVESGLRCIEVPLTTPGAVEEILGAVQRHPGPMFGAGTVVDRDGAQAAVDHGAHFLVTPTVAPEVGVVAREAGVPVLMGALTPTEVLAADRAGAWAVKLFPAAFSGPAYMRALREPLPEIAFVPTGGVAVEDVSGWLSAGARAVALGSSLIGDAPEGGSVEALAERCRRLLEALRAST